MKTEFECRIIDINKSQIRNKLKNHNAVLVREEYLQRRYTFDNKLLRSKGEQWLRLRDEGNKITLAYKSLVSYKLNGMKEIEIVVSNFKDTKDILLKAGMSVSSYQENYREEWQLNNCILTIDTWPIIKPVLEIEGKNDKDVNNVIMDLGFKKNDLMFGRITDVYKLKGLYIGEFKILKF